MSARLTSEITQLRQELEQGSLDAVRQHLDRVTGGRRLGRLTTHPDVWLPLHGRLERAARQCWPDGRVPSLAVAGRGPAGDTGHAVLAIVHHLASALDRSEPRPLAAEIWARIPDSPFPTLRHRAAGRADLPPLVGRRWWAVERNPSVLTELLARMPFTPAEIQRLWDAVQPKALGPGARATDGASVRLGPQHLDPAPGAPPPGAYAEVFDAVLVPGEAARHAFASRGDLPMPIRHHLLTLGDSGITALLLGAADAGELATAALVDPIPDAPEAVVPGEMLSLLVSFSLHPGRVPVGRQVQAVVAAAGRGWTEADRATEVSAWIRRVMASDRPFTRDETAALLHRVPRQSRLVLVDALAGTGRAGATAQAPGTGDWGRR